MLANLRGGVALLKVAREVDETSAEPQWQDDGLGDTITGVESAGPVARVEMPDEQ